MLIALVDIALTPDGKPLVPVPVPAIIGLITYSQTRYAPTAINAYLMMSSVFIIPFPFLVLRITSCRIPSRRTTPVPPLPASGYHSPIASQDRQHMPGQDYPLVPGSQWTAFSGLNTVASKSVAALKEPPCLPCP